MGAGSSLNVEDIKDDGSGELREDHEVLQSQERDRDEMKAIYEKDEQKYPRDASFLMFYAAAEGDIERVKELAETLGPGGIRNMKCHSVHGGMTPLHIAALSGNREVVEFLIQNHAPVTARDAENKTPDQYAEESGYEELAQFMRLKWLGTRDPAIDSLKPMARAPDEFLLSWERRQWEEEERKRIKASQPPKPNFVRVDKKTKKICSNAASDQKLLNYKARDPEYQKSIDSSHFSKTRRGRHYSIVARHTIERHEKLAELASKSSHLKLR